ncbi:MAG: glucose-6-phosphate isomerase, partial [Halapricum sp.]
MRVDIGNALDRVATPGVPEDTLDRLDDRVADAHARIEAGRANSEHGYEALNLPETVDTDEIRSAVEPFADSEYL